MPEAENERVPSGYLNRVLGPYYTYRDLSGEWRVVGFQLDESGRKLSFGSFEEARAHFTEGLPWIGLEEAERG